MRKTLSFILAGLIFQSMCVGCAFADRTPNAPSAKGKFLLGSVREGTTMKDAKTYVLENSKTRRVSGPLGRLGSPKWSHDGKKFLVADGSKHIIYVMNESGEILQEIPTNGYPTRYQWFSGDQKIIYGSQEDSNNHMDVTFRIYTRDFSTQETVLIHTFQKNQYLTDLRLSHDGSKFAFYVTAPKYKKIPRQLGVFHLSTGEIKTFPSMFVLGWMPDDIYIVVQGNVKDDGTKFDNLFGIVGTINTKTGELKILRHETKFYFEPSLSKDGKYLVYVRGVAKDTQCVFLNELATDKETQVTYPEPIGNTGQYSTDTYADWYQGD